MLNTQEFNILEMNINLYSYLPIYTLIYHTLLVKRKTLAFTISFNEKGNYQY